MAASRCDSFATGYPRDARSLARPHRRALVTGGTGFIGANLVRRLLRDGWEVHLLLRPQHGKWRIADICDALRVHIADMADDDAARAAMRRVRPNVVFHLAAHGSYSWQQDGAEILRTNLVATRILAHAAVDAGVERFILAGSSSEYGRKDRAPLEDEAVEPDSDYAVSKAAATLYCRYLARRARVPMPTLRLYAVYGPWEEPRRLVPTLLLEGLSGQLPPLADPETARDFVWVGDAVEALVLAATRSLHEPDAVFNVGTGRQTRLLEIVEMTRRLLGIDAQPVWRSLPARSWDTDCWVADSGRIRRDLGWMPRTDLQAGLVETLAWLRADPARLAFYRDRIRRGEASPPVAHSR
jgi:dolichol-phosphate mannosyltransferase